MNIQEFHKKLKQHCDKLNGECRQCCFVDYCYSQKRDVYGKFLTQVVSRASNLSDSDTDNDAQVIHNQNNVSSPAKSNERI